MTCAAASSGLTLSFSYTALVASKQLREQAHETLRQGTAGQDQDREQSGNGDEKPQCRQKQQEEKLGSHSSPSVPVAFLGDKLSPNATLGLMPLGIPGVTL